MKLRKIVKVGATVQYEQSYLGGLEYRKNGTGSTRIEALYHAEGRYLNLNAEVNNTLLWQKEYTLKDHLGNARISFTDKNANGIVDIPSDIVQENHYYPFGLNYEGGWRMNDAVARDNKYQYNGKEWNDDFGLNWNDYGARWYDAAVGRFTTRDRFAEKYYPLSPYQYGANNPILNIDINGDSIIVNGAQNQQYFQQDLQSAFGEKASDFSFTDKGKLTFTGDKKLYKGDEKKVLNGLLKVLKDKKIDTNVQYSEEVGKTGIKVGDHGGGITILKSETPMVPMNAIYLLPNPPSQLEYIEVSQGFPAKKVDNNRSSSLFHELGHVIYDGQDQSQVINYENNARSIQKSRGPDGEYKAAPLQKRTLDITHNPAATATQIKN